jgi:hypothetical protein
MITGSSDKTTDYFNVPGSEWRITWDYTPHFDSPEYAVFGFFVYPKGTTTQYVDNIYKSGAAETVGTTYIHKGPGNYYLKIIVANIEDYRITVEYDADTVPNTTGSVALGGVLILIIIAAVAIGAFYIAKSRKKKIVAPPSLTTT